MTFPILKSGNWAFGEILTSAQMNVLNGALPNALDGGAGGSYSPTATIVIKGKGASIGSAIGDDVYFSTANAKWGAAASDFGASLTLALRLVDICALREGQLVAVANNAADKIAMSQDDGASWVDISSTIGSPQTITLDCCASSTANALLVAGGNSVKVYYTLDAATWLNTTAPGTPTDLYKAVYSPVLDTFFLAGRTASAPYIVGITSSIVATQRTVPGAITGTNSVKSMAIANAGAHSGRMVISWAAATKFVWSDDGTTWNASTTTVTSAASGYYIAYGDGVFVALHAGGVNLAYVSTDADTWTTSGVTKPNATSLLGLAAVNGVFVAYDANFIAWVSVDKGATWEQLYLKYLAYASTGSIRGVNKRIHAFASDGTNVVDYRSRKLGFGDGTF
jgi:hypothetical protein